MSAIAAFYVVPGKRLTDVVAAATPAPGGWFRPARDTFRDVLRAAIGLNVLGQLGNFIDAKFAIRRGYPGQLDRLPVPSV
jgi:hypothetical protein